MNQSNRNAALKIQIKSCVMERGLAVSAQELAAVMLCCSELLQGFTHLKHFSKAF